MNPVLSKCVLFSVTLFAMTSNALAYDPYERESKDQPMQTEVESIEYLLEKPSDRQLSLATKSGEEAIPAVDSENITTDVTFSADVVYLLRNTGASE